MGEEILSLSTIVQRATVNIASKRHPNGKLYELVNLADLGPFEHAVILDRDAETRPLFASKKKLTVAQERQLEKALDDIVKLLIPTLEPAVLAELTIQQKQTITLTWVAKVNAEGAAEGKAQAPRRRTGAGSSRASKRSTAATRKRGSTRGAGR